jgi:DNA-binding transcriptional LysR family regulator
MLPDLDSLLLFSRAAETGSLTKAAETLHIAAPAASRRLALLEHQFRVQLFDRHPRGLTLTPAGACLLEHVRGILDAVYRSQIELSNYATGQAAVLRVCANTSAMAQFLPQDLADFQELHPDIRLVLDEQWSEACAQSVRAARADLAIVLEGPWTKGLPTWPYRSDRIAAVFRRGKAPKGDCLALVDLMGQNLVALEDRSSMMRLLAEKAAQAGQTFTLGAKVKSFEAVCRLVQVGSGVGLLPLRAAQAFEIAMGLEVIPLSDTWAVRQMSICAGNSQPSPALQALIDHLTKVEHSNL